MAGRLISDFPVSSKPRWVKTPARLVAGRAVQACATGRWRDAYIDCSPEGYWAPLFYLLGRPPRIPDDQRYFRLLGRILDSDVEPTHDDARETFVIGAGRRITPARSGRLFVFANDRADRYFNNKGEVALTVEEL